MLKRRNETTSVPAAQPEAAQQTAAAAAPVTQTEAAKEAESAKRDRPLMVDLSANRSPEQMARELLALVESGRAPVGFDVEQAVRDKLFLQLLAELPTYAAVRVYVAEKRSAEAVQEAMQTLMDKLRARADLPQPMRTGSAAAPAMDYMALSSEDFAALEKRMRQAKQAGKRVLL